MSGARLTPRGIHEIAHELCELFQQQIDDLQQGLDLVNLEPYSHRHERITELEAELRALRRSPL
jgi:polyhydroxyalkanoate synthesis regulator phasin